MNLCLFVDMVICDMGRLWLFAFFICFAAKTTGIDAEEGCNSPQHLEVGRRGIISCSFEEGFSIVYWYDSKNHVTELAIVEYREDTGKRGQGIESGEFDIFPNGSLIIMNVSLQHDHYFTAVKVNSLEDDLVPHFIRVVATVKPVPAYPVIKQCGYDRTVCFAEVAQGSGLNCSIQDSRPGFDLEWMIVTSNGTKNITSNTVATSNGVLTTSSVQSADPFAYSSTLSLLLCKSNNYQWLLATSESFILIQNDASGISTENSISKQSKQNSRLELKCTDSDLTFLVWKYTHKHDEKFTAILYGAFLKNNFTISGSQGYELDADGSLVISELKVQNEGYYACVFGNGTNDGITVYAIEVFVPPNPAYPVVDGCNPGQYCVLEVHRQGILTCTVRGIRPKMKLIWQTFHESSSTEISFSDQETTVTTHEDDTFDVSVTAHYNAKHSANDKITIECKVPDTEGKIFHLSSKLDLLFVTVSEPTPGFVALTEETTGQSYHMSWIIALVVTAGLVSLLLCAVVFIRAKLMKGRSLPNKLKKDEEIPMMSVSPPQPSGDQYEAIKQNFVTCLKTKYEDLCAAIQPIPYLREKMYSVDQVYVEGGIQFSLSADKWGELKSYQEVFSDSRLISKRRIIEGEAGYGKSTLALQLAYDWYTTDKGSYLQDKEIFILLRLRQLGGVGSIYKAIRKCLLPTDSKLSEVDVENILQKFSKSVIIVLDGYDEYPDQDKKGESFVTSIMKKDIMQQFEVILTTRSSCLPKEYASITKRIRLTGFDDNAREAYLEKVFGSTQNGSVEKIKERMRENPFLEDLFQVPLFFVLYAHISKGNYEDTKFSSVTVFFRYIISCLHSHCKNKLTDSDKEKMFAKNKLEHSKLNKLAFDGLSGKSQQLVWEKEIIKTELGEEFYDQYIYIGILIEDEICHITDDPGTVISEHIQYKKEVRFYHKLFCEWYAAHYLAEYASKPEVKFDPRDDEVKKTVSPKENEKNDILQNVDPAELQYVYRFACGLNLIAAEKIFQYLKTVCGGERFAILCIVEQTGKVDTPTKEIRQLCASTLSMYGNHSHLLQRSTIQLLEIASRQKIPITHVWLCDCFQSVDDTCKHLILTSGFKFPKLKTLKALDIRESGKEMTEKETLDILNYCKQCNELQTLKFMYTLQPRAVSVESLDLLHQRELKVIWDTDFSSFSLDLKSGVWQTQAGPMTDAEYQEQVEQFHRLQKLKRDSYDHGEKSEF